MRGIVALVLLTLLAQCAPAQKSVDFTQGDPASAARVRAEFLHAWNGYKQYAWGHDELKPLRRATTIGTAPRST
jgi:hypothetical protein